VVWEPLSDRTWAAFSSLSGETHLLNESSLCLLEALSSTQWLGEHEVVLRVAEATGSTAEEIEPLLADAWFNLVNCGIVLRRDDPDPVEVGAKAAPAAESAA
jgi:hypothetical protein